MFLPYVALACSRRRGVKETVVVKEEKKVDREKRSQYVYVIVQY